MNVKVLKLKTEDGIYLNGFLKFSEKKNKKVIISVHGMAGNCFNKRENEISEQSINHGIDSFIFNNRGSDIIKYLERSKAKSTNNVMGGSACENFYDSYYDIKSAILSMIELGYDEIYLCGHSLGSTKIVYSYQRFLEDNEKWLKKIKAVILLSLVDVGWIFKTCAGNKYEDYINYAINRSENIFEFELMPRESFMYPISVKSFLTYNVNNEKIDIARYSQKDFNFKELNSIKVPIFMRWGEKNELIKQNTNELLELIKNKIKNENLNVGIIENTDHFYRKEEKILANQIMAFLDKI